MRGDTGPELLIAIFLIGLGTYLMRALPLLGGLSSGPEAAEQRSTEPRQARLDRLLKLVSPSIITALLVISVVPEATAPDFGASLARSILALVPTVIAAARWRNLGLTVLTGIAAYWLCSLWI